ncbi:DUF4435 domain-containing protein [Variovorax paradoxus]|uniref:DUF4435 domain-containing protein n=1 Tax=Variovorax paradoxus TaxID=34073 RepID=UPI003ECD716F
MDEEYSFEAKAAADLFVSDFATHIFYVEDSNSEVFYERLFGRLFPNLKDYAVVCMHGKSNIIKKASQPKQLGLSYIFLVDKDFDDLLASPVAGLTYLDRYSIENYLAELGPITSVFVEQHPEGKSARAINLECSDYEKYREELDARLIDITKYFVIVRRYAIDMASTKIDISDLLADAEKWHPMPTREWILAYRQKILENSGLLEEDLKSEHDKAFEPSPGFPDATTIAIHHVPGKHLLPSILKYLGARTIEGFEKSLGKSLYIRILNHVSIDRFKIVKERLLQQHPSLNAFH